MGHLISTKTKVIQLRYQGYSLNEIVRITGISKSTAQGWVRNIRLSDSARNQLIRKEREGKIKGNNSRRKIIPNFGNNPSKYPVQLVRFMSHAFFDGGIYKDSVNYYSSHKVLLDTFATDGLTLFGFSANEYVSKYNIFRATYYSKNLVDFITKAKVSFFNDVVQMPDLSKIAFLKAFFDDEGTITYIPETNKKAVRGFQKDLRVLESVCTVLNDFGINSSIENIRYLPEVVIRRQLDLEKFQRIVGFSPGVNFLATRKNSRYDEPVEKRLILAEAVKGKLTFSVSMQMLM